jgi:hypothetical protein
MTDDEMAELALMKLANEHGKFALSFGSFSDEQTLALERLQIREWVRLIDVNFIASGPMATPFRVFMLTQPALTWLRKNSN